jgi:hypothetical protein
MILLWLKTMAMVLKMRHCSVAIVEETLCLLLKTKLSMHLKVSKTNQFVVLIAVMPRNSA